jgi:hypothetical protein
MRPSTAMIRRNATRGVRGLSDYDRRRIYNAFLDGGRDVRATADRFRIGARHLRAMVRKIEAESVGTTYP